MNRIALMLALVLAIFAFGCSEQGDNPTPADDSGDDATSDSGDVTDTDGGNAGDSGDALAFDYTPPEVGQWIAYGVEGEEGEFKLSIVAEEEGCLWYQIEVDGEAVAQVLVDPSLLDELIALSGENMDEFVADPVAFIEENMPENGNFMENEDSIENMMMALRAIKKVKINDGTQLMLLDMAGVPEMVEQMLAENPDLLGQGMQMDPGQDENMQEFLAQLEQAEFTAEELEMDGLVCMKFTATHPDEGTIEAVVSPELPIIPVLKASVTPNDPEEDGGVVMVTGYGYEGAQNLMTGEPDQVIPVAMMLQGMASQFQSAGGMPE